MPSIYIRILILTLKYVILAQYIMSIAVELWLLRLRGAQVKPFLMEAGGKEPDKPFDGT